MPRDSRSRSKPWSGYVTVVSPVGIMRLPLLLKSPPAVELRPLKLVVELVLYRRLNGDAASNIPSRRTGDK